MSGKESGLKETSAVLVESERSDLDDTSFDAGSSNVTIMGWEDSHATLRRVLSARLPCKILDAAWGKGALVQFLREHGWDVHCGDLVPDLFRLDDIPFKTLNLNRRLPYQDASFDAALRQRCASAL